jgi:outer membrane protein
MAIGYSRSTANFVARPGSLPSSVNSTAALSLTGYDFFTSSLGAQQLLWDFGQVWNRWDASKATLAAQQEVERAAVVAQDLQLRTAYFSAAAQRELIEVAKATLANTEAHLAQVEGFVKAGTHPEIDLAQSRSDRANAKLQVLTATNAYLVAKARLNQAMGVEGSSGYDVVDHTAPEVDLEAKHVDEVLQVAVNSRPELTALEAQVRGQDFTLRALRGAFWPMLSATAQGTAQARSLDAITPNLSIGVNLSWQLYQGGQTLAQVAQAESTLVQLTAQRDLTRQQVRFDVEQALLDVAAGKEALELSQEVVEAATEQQRLAEGRYKAGAGSIIEWGDAQVRVTTALGQRVQAAFTLATARARLLAALGR